MSLSLLKTPFYELDIGIKEYRYISDINWSTYGKLVVFIYQNKHELSYRKSFYNDQP